MGLNQMLGRIAETEQTYGGPTVLDGYGAVSGTLRAPGRQ